MSFERAQSASILGVAVFGAALALALRPSSTASSDPALDAAFATITQGELEADLQQLACPQLEGRDSPSAGLLRAATYIEHRFEAAGIKPFDDAHYERAFQRDLPTPVPEECALDLTVGGAEARKFEFATDFVPLTGCDGSASGEIVFLGFGIDSKAEKFDEVEGKDLFGKIALIVEGEPRNAKRFDGPELTPDATLWTKLETLRDHKLAGVLVARRAPEVSPAEAKKKGAPEPAKLAFRHTWATWVGQDMTAVPSGLPKSLLPALEISMACANQLLGEDVEALATKIDRTVLPQKRAPKGRKVHLASRTKIGSVAINNLVGKIPGSDEKLQSEWLVIGAHYDHVGVDDRGRVGCGADDNASGTAAMLEVAQALASAKPRRSVMVCSFAAEEDGLLGSDALCKNLPVPRESIVAMVNMDMVGRGKTDEVAVLGIVQNPELEKVLERARKLNRTGVKTIVVRQGEDLFQRSDHYSFHKLGVPVLFFFEGLPITDNPDYHTWRDTLDKLDYDKMTRTARLVLDSAWLLANDDERPPKPRE
jgi:hypothetical protein